MFLVAGLGNPGSEYVGTRHNIGFEVVDAVAERLGWVPRGGFDKGARRAFDGLALDGTVHTTKGPPQKLLLLKPMTYMNESGRSIQSAAGFYKLTNDQLMVIVDELALPAGRLRIRAEGSDGGHNGLKSVQRMLGTPRYPRLRMGIDPPPPFMQGRDYVLARFDPVQRKAVDDAVARAAGAILTWIDAGIEKAMNQFNVET